MYFVRALNKFDVMDYNNQNDISCMLKKNKYKNEFDDEANKILSSNFGYTLDQTYTHVNGKGLFRSPWISLSTNFDYTASEYAIPQAGKFNMSSDRKPIALIKIDDAKVLDNPESIKALRDKKIDEVDNIVLNLTGKKLVEYNHADAVIPKYEENNPGSKAAINRFIYGATPDGFSGYSNIASEYLIYDHIKNSEVVTIIYPIMQDLIYGLRTADGKRFVDLDNMEKFIKRVGPYVEEYLNNMNTFLNEIYSSYRSGINLTDYLINHYNQIPGNNIEEKYQILKEAKRDALDDLLWSIKRVYSFEGDLSIKTVLDHRIFVACYSNINKSNYSTKQLNDILLIEKDDQILKYDPVIGKYQLLDVDIKKYLTPAELKSMFELTENSKKVNKKTMR